MPKTCCDVFKSLGRDVLAPAITARPMRRQNRLLALAIAPYGHSSCSSRAGPPLGGMLDTGIVGQQAEERQDVRVWWLRLSNLTSTAWVASQPKYTPSR